MKVLVTGGAGFIGTNAVDRLLREAHEVVVVDNLSRPGSGENLAWLRERHGEFAFAREDIGNFEALKAVFETHQPFDALLHFAAQVAVTTSVEDPRTDFKTNALGTLNVLEAIRELELDPVVLYTSTNKVYGALSSVGVIKGENRYHYTDLEHGISEQTPLDFYSPYGCSKGAADQYVRDYHRIYGLRTIVFRNSCVYGPRQFGIEDQGWLAWFVIAAVLGRSIQIYGNGKQVRDVLYIDDLLDAIFMAVEESDTTQGQVYNIGGGSQYSLAVWSEFGPLLAELLGRDIPVTYHDWRPGDQPIYISDISKARHDFGWYPKVSAREGVEKLYNWVCENINLFS